MHLTRTSPLQLIRIPTRAACSILVKCDRARQPWLVCGLPVNRAPLRVGVHSALSLARSPRSVVLLALSVSHFRCCNASAPARKTAVRQRERH